MRNSNKKRLAPDGSELVPTCRGQVPLLPLAVFLLLYLCCTTVLRAQFGVWGGYSSTMIKYGSFDDFRASYNAVNGGAMKSEMPEFGLSGGISAGVEAHAKVFIGELSIHTMKGSTIGEFISGEKREFEIRNKQISGGFGLGYGWEKFYIYAVGGLTAGDILISSSYFYHDGTQSFGSEKILNGNYFGFNLGGYYGISTCIPITKNIKIMLRINKCGYSKFDAKFSLTDIFGSSQTALAGTPHPDGLPVDYAAYLSESGGYTYKGEYVGTDLGGWRVFCCLHFQFGNL